MTFLPTDGGKVSGWAGQLWQFEAGQVRYEQDPLPAQAAFDIRPGTRPVLISAPHGACHWRQGWWKGQDGFTAALAHLLAEQTGAHALYTVRRISPDPNFEDDSDYKRALAEIVARHDIGLVLDLHGASPLRPFGLALGTIDGRTCPAYEGLILDRLGAQQFGPARRHRLDRLWVNQMFKGGARQRTVTRFAWEQCGVNAAQVEINGYLRVVRARPGTSGRPAFQPADPARLERTIRALIEVILAI